jgi:hypothetical protein
MNERPYFCCGQLPSEGHTKTCVERNCEDELIVGEVIRLDGRWLRVCGMPDGQTVCRDYLKRVAVRNFATNRLSYIPEWRLLRAR